MIPQFVQTKASLSRRASILLLRSVLGLVVIQRIPSHHASLDKLKHLARVGQQIGGSLLETVQVLGIVFGIGIFDVVLESIFGIPHFGLHLKSFILKGFFDKDIERLENLGHSKGQVGHFFIGCVRGPLNQKSFLKFAKDVEILFLCVTSYGHAPIHRNLKHVKLLVRGLLIREQSAFAQLCFQIGESQQEVFGRYGQRLKCILGHALESFRAFACNGFLGRRTILHECMNKVVLQSWVDNGIRNRLRRLYLPLGPHLSQWLPQFEMQTNIAFIP